MSNEDVVTRRAAALESGGTGPDPGDAEIAGRLRLLLAHPATWTAPLGTEIPVPPVARPVVIPEPTAAVPPPVSEPATVPPVPPVETTPRVRPRRRWFRPPVLAIAAGACAVVVALLWLIVGPITSPSRDSVRVELAGTDLARGASASVVATEADGGWRITLDADGLPGAPEDTYYEGWLTRPDIQVPLGTFHLRDQGEIELWSGVRVPDYSTFTVTRQRVGGGQEPGDRVLSGPIRG